MACQVSPQDAERFAWEALSRQAGAKEAGDLSVSFSVVGFDGNALLGTTLQMLVEAGLATPSEKAGLYSDVTVGVAAREVFHSALRLGLIVPGKFGQAYNWSAQVGAYQFTNAGREFFRRGTASPSVPGHLVARTQEMCDAGRLDPGIVPLVGEAQTCWMMGCLRAAMVLIGLASEGTFLTLIGELRRYRSPPTSGAPNWNDWERVNNDAMAFYPRWRSAVALLENVKERLQRAYRSTRPDWWGIWEPLPGGLESFGECVRAARNTAAHSVGDVFTNAQVGLLLASLPTMLGVVSELTGFLSSPPDGVSLPGL